MQGRVEPGSIVMTVQSIGRAEALSFKKSVANHAGITFEIVRSYWNHAVERDLHGSGPWKN
jgi:hypothetical protein